MQDAESLVDDIMNSLPGMTTGGMVIIDPSTSKRKKRGSNDDAPTDSGDTDVPIICDPLGPSDLVLVQMVTEGEAPRTVYDRILLEMAEEAAHLKKLREAFAGIGLPFSKISRDLVAILKELSEIMEKKIKEQAMSGAGSSGKIDFASENFQRVFMWILREVAESCKEAHIPQHSVDLLFSKMQQRMNGFETIAEGIYQGEEASALKKRKAKSKGEVQV